MNSKLSSYWAAVNCTQWSEDNQLCTVLYDFISIQTFGVVKGKNESNPQRLMYNRDHLSIKIKASEGYRKCAWSPSAASQFHGCLLAVLTRTGRVILFAPTSKDYAEVCEFEAANCCSISWLPVVCRPGVGLLAIGAKKGTLQIFAVSSRQASLVASVNITENKWISSISWFNISGDNKNTGLVVGASDGEVSMWRLEMEGIRLTSAERVASLVPVCGVPVEIIKVVDGTSVSKRIYVAVPGNILSFECDLAFKCLPMPSILLPSISLVTGLVVQTIGASRVYVTLQDGRVLCYESHASQAWVLAEDVVLRFKHHFQRSKVVTFGEDSEALPNDGGDEDAASEGDADDDDDDDDAMSDNERDILHTALNIELQQPHPGGITLSNSQLFFTLIYDVRKPFSLANELDSRKISNSVVLKTVSADGPLISVQELLNVLKSRSPYVLAWDLMMCANELDDFGAYRTWAEYLNDSWLGKLLVEMAKVEELDTMISVILRCMPPLPAIMPERLQVLKQLDTRIVKRVIIVRLSSLVNAIDADGNDQDDAITDIKSYLLMLQLAVKEFTKDAEVIELASKTIDKLEQRGISCDEYAFCLNQVKQRLLNVVADGDEEIGAQNSLSTILKGQVDRIATEQDTFTAVERCPLCQSDVPFTDLTVARCLNAECKPHVWSRCETTFCIIEDPFEIAVCKCCKRKEHVSQLSAADSDIARVDLEEFDVEVGGPLNCNFCDTKVSRLL